MAASGGVVLTKVLTSEECEKVPEIIRIKIEAFINDSLEDYLTAKAVYETSKVNSEEKLKKFSDELIETNKERDILRAKLNCIQDELNELKEKFSSAESELSKSQEKVRRLEEESSKYRQERNLAVDDREEAVQMIERRDAQLKRLQEDINVLSKQLENAVHAKCEAIAKNDEVEGLKLELSCKEKRLDKERALLLERIQGLQSDVAKHSTDLVNLRREHTANVLLLQSQLAEKTEELRHLIATNSQLNDTINSLKIRVESLTQKLVAQCENETKLSEGYQQEIKSQTKLADLYKGLSEEAASKNAELTMAVKELQKLLEDASRQYGDLETKLKEQEVKHEVIIEKKKECISNLKKELDHANVLVKVAKQEQLENVVENLSPAAAAAGRLIKSGMTLTQIYCQYAQVSEELILEKEQNRKLNLYVNTILKEIEEKAPILKKQREDYDYAMNTVESLSVKVDEMESECAKLRHSSHEAEKKANHLTRENKCLSESLTDLSRQVCFLLKEVEESRGVSVPLLLTNEPLRADVKTSSDVISKHLVTFSDIQELQATNRKLLAVIRELSNKQEMDEKEIENSKVLELKEQVRSLQNLYNEMLENEKQTRKALEVVKGQRDMYRVLFQQQVQGKNVTTPMNIDDELENNEAPTESKVEELQKPLIGGGHADKIAELDKKLHERQSELTSLRSEFDNYRKERSVNEKMLNEELERYRTDAQKKSKQISDLLAKSEYSQQNFKTLQANANLYKSQIASMESKINSYTSIIAKHEQSIMHFRDEALNANTKLSRAEVLLENLRQEHQLLKESEARLSKEREILIREQQGQKLLLASLDTIKASMERSEVEGKVRLESRLDEANKECTALRHRLQDEQDRFRERMDLLEKQTALAKQRLEEELEIANRVRAELEEAQKQLQQKQAQIDSINSKMREIKHTIVPDPTTEERAKSLEQQLGQKECEVNSLKEQLALSKKNVQEFRDMAQISEKQLAEVTEAYSKYKEESSVRVKEMEEKELEMKNTVKKLQEEVKTLTTNKEQAVGSLRELMNIQKEELSDTKDELGKNKERLDNALEQLKTLQEAHDATEKKYAAGLTQHNDTQKELSGLKEELEILRDDYKKIEAEKDKAVEALNLGKQSWETQECSLKQEIEKMQVRLTELNKLNDLLYEQLETLGLKLTVSQSNKGNDSSLGEMSLSESEIQGTDQLMKVMKYLRNEKNHAVSQLETLREENLNLKSQVEVLTHQLEEVNRTLNEERSRQDIENVTVTKHSELMRKVETLNTVIDTNQLLREENKKLTTRVTELEKQIEKIENQVVRTNQERITKLLGQVDQLTTENTALKTESARWKQRSNVLLERSNKNSPEDFKRLVMEKENLQKQLNTEKEEIRSMRTEKTKLDEQLAQLKQQQQTQTEEITALRNELNQLATQLNEAKENNKQKDEQLTKLTQNVTVQEKTLSEIRNKEIQIRQIAKKYKVRYEELSRTIEENKESNTGEMSTEAQERLREEGRREAETSQAEKLKELSDQVSTTQAEADTLRKENDVLKASSADKEERAKGLLKNARQRIMQLTEEKNKLNKDLLDARSRLEYYERNKDESSRRSEKERTELQSEKERLSRELELLTQRLNLLQRQLEKQQGSKPSTSSGLTEKANVEPPTANIKPMAGPSSSGSKQQPIQHSVTVTPWRGGPETPFASIRPISQSRTAAVHPTTNQSQGQAALVPPQQQMVHTSTGVAEALSSSPTSSHTDYMPATSSALTFRQATVPPTQSTQDMDAETESQQQGQSSNALTQAVSIALVLPQPTAQTSSSQTTQTQVVSAENSSVVSASNQEQSLDQSVVSASSHTPSSDQSFVSASSGHTQMCSTASAYYRQQEMDESAGQSEQSVVASSQQQLAEQSVTVSSQQAGPNEQGMSDQSVASSQQNDQPVASSHHGVSDQSVASSRQDQSVASSQLVMSDQSVASSRQTQAEQSVAVASSQASTSSNTVTTTQTAPGLKRPRDGSVPNEEGESSKVAPPNKRSRAALSGEGGEMLLRADGLEVEYQVPTSSQRDQEDDIILVDTTDEEEDDDEGMPDDGDMAMNSYEVGEGPDIDENITDQDNNEVEIIEDSNEVPNQSESSSSGPVEGAGGGMSEATSSGHSNVSSNQASPGHFTRRASAIPPLNRQQQQLLLPQGYEDAGDDSIVPSTPTLFVPRRTDGFGEAVSSPHVPSGRFTFADNNSSPSTRAGVAQVASEGMDDTRMDLSQLEDAGTGRSVPTTPLQVSPQEPAQGEVGQSSSDEPNGLISDNCNMIPNITVTVSHDMPPPSDADVELEEQVEGRLTEGSVETMDEPELVNLELPEEGGDGVSSEGEKQQVVVEDIEEGREAEASEAGPSRSTSSVVNRGSGTARRSNRQVVSRSRAKPPPQRITWDEDNSASQRGTSQFRVRAPTPTRGISADASRGGSMFRGRARRMRGYHSTFQSRF
ncbi:nuclear basket protein megator isoform X2 [Lycorma delicatula]|uniref:nuclear basket protein megator isoform X2 n=1 Tax=Lycorma delicatula TaxID=130591 RepID=UPI003F51A754